MSWVGAKKEAMVAISEGESPAGSQLVCRYNVTEDADAHEVWEGCDRRPKLSFSTEDVIERKHDGQKETGTGARAPKDKRPWKDSEKTIHCCDNSWFSHGPCSFDVTTVLKSL